MQKVLKSEIQSGGRSIFPPYLPLAKMWLLTLDCGHQVERLPRYPKNARTRGGGWWKRHIADDYYPAPKRVRCELCARKGNEGEPHET